MAVAAEMPEAGAAAADEAGQEGADEDTGDDAPPLKAPRSRWLDEEQDEEPEAPLNKVRLLAALHQRALCRTVYRCEPLCCTSDA